MKMVTMNHTERASGVADLVREHCIETHRGAMRFWPCDTDKTLCLVLYGNDGYTNKPDSNLVIRARTRAYVHRLYTGLTNLLPEGAVEFGTTDDGNSWAIVAHFTRFQSRLSRDDGDDGLDDFDDGTNHEQLVAFWNEIVWNQWKSQLSYATE